MSDNQQIRLNLGAGPIPIEGYQAIDIHHGESAFPLSVPDESVDEIRASHLLEHFCYTKTPEILAGWVRALKPGGVLRIAVPDFDKIVASYQSRRGDPLEPWLFGGHVDEHDFHQAMFNTEKLRALLELSDLMDIHPWVSEIDDGAAMPESLNLQGTKRVPPERPLKVCAAMSVPRLGFMDNFFCVFEGLMPLGISLRKFGGAFWEQSLSRCITEIIAASAPDAILTIDYDSVFTSEDVQRLITLMQDHPEADAICAMQLHRTKPLPLMTIKDEQGKIQRTIDRDALEHDLIKVSTAHFGLTLIRTTSLADFPKPWFLSQPAPDGSWGDKHIDADIWFWKRWAELGKSIYQANRVPIGHADMSIRWPTRDLGETHQHPTKFWTNGHPENCWQ